MDSAGHISFIVPLFEKPAVRKRRSDRGEGKVLEQAAEPRERTGDARVGSESGQERGTVDLRGVGIELPGVDIKDKGAPLPLDPS